jgi:hypothetical protein
MVGTLEMPSTLLSNSGIADLARPMRTLGGQVGRSPADSLSASLISPDSTQETRRQTEGFPLLYRVASFCAL